MAASVGDIGGFAFKPPATHRPTIMGQKQMVASGHYLASMGAECHAGAWPVPKVHQASGATGQPLSA